MTNCPYSMKCSSEGLKCSSCAHNADAKKDHYSPINPYPIYPTTPWYGDWYITCGTDTTGVTKY